MKHGRITEEHIGLQSKIFGIYLIMIIKKLRSLLTILLIDNT